MDSCFSEDDSMIYCLINISLQMSEVIKYSTKYHVLHCNSLRIQKSHRLYIHVYFSLPSQLHMISVMDSWHVCGMTLLIQQWIRALVIDSSSPCTHSHALIQAHFQKSTGWALHTENTQTVFYSIGILFSVNTPGAGSLVCRAKFQRKTQRPPGTTAYLQGENNSIFNSSISFSYVLPRNHLFLHQRSKYMSFSAVGYHIAAKI